MALHDAKRLLGGVGLDVASVRAFLDVPLAGVRQLMSGLGMREVALVGA